MFPWELFFRKIQQLTIVFICENQNNKKEVIEKSTKEKREDMLKEIETVFFC